MDDNDNDMDYNDNIIYSAHTDVNIWFLLVSFKDVRAQNPSHVQIFF